VRGKLADVLDEADVAEIATGAHKAIKAEEAVAKLAKIEADAEREKEKVRDERRRMAYTVAGSIVAGVVLLVVGGWIGHSVGRGTTPASAATGVGASTASVVRPAVLHRPAATTSTSE
jgi:F0F1-type ATP synthase assembly protein I